MAFSSVFSWLIKKRVRQIDLFKEFPLEVQNELLSGLVHRGVETEWGRRYGFTGIDSFAQFQKAVPLSTYEEVKSDIQRVIDGAEDVLWPGEVRWFAKSSGTTSDRSKLIPVTKEALEDCHFKGGKDLLGLHVHHRPKSDIYKGKTLVVGGSSELHPLRSEAYTGDLSAIIIKNLPLWVEFRRIPGKDIALLGDWEEKMEKMALHSMDEDVTVISGVPSWTLVLIRRILELKGTDNLMDVWPNLELYMHGGVSFSPYRDQYETLIPSRSMTYLETYNASEGFFGIQDRPGADDMLLTLDYGIFYEFIPLSESHKEQPETIGLADVELGKVYEMVITTNAGLWRYRVGDTVRFTSRSPFRIQVAGRTKQFINVFGEELMVHNVEQALQQACHVHHAQVADYSVAPIYMEEGKPGGHEWAIEFTEQPKDLMSFTVTLDRVLMDINSDYAAKRTNDFNLRLPRIHVLEPGHFYAWMERRGKLGGQHKVPRLSNDRKYLESILQGVIEMASGA